MKAGNRTTLLLLWGALFLKCSMVPFTGGSGEETTNGRVTGAVVTQNGTSALNTAVRLFPAGYDPVKDTAVPLHTTADSFGGYSFSHVPPGDYTILALHTGSGTRALVSGIHVAGDTIALPAAALRAPGSLKVALPSGINSATGYVFIPGTTSSIFLNYSTTFVMLDSVPAGTVPAVSYASTNAAGSTILRYDVAVAPGDTTVVYNPLWKYARQLTFNTTPIGANVAGDVMEFPVLIRLTSSNFNFSQAQSNGADIRFTKSGSTFLPYEIERWVGANSVAEIWVKVDTIFGNDSGQSITMYWGNVNAADSSNGAAVFDTAAGFSGVWHLGQPTGTTVLDATANGINGTATATATVSGAIGTAQSFNGASSLIQAVTPSDSTLNFPENGNYSVSAWVSANALDSLYHGIVYKSNFEYGLQIRPENNWEFFTFVDGTGWEGSRSPASANSWHFLTGVRRGAQQYLYVDGACVDSTEAQMTSNLSRVYDSPLEIGHCPDGGLEPDRYFSGIIDEVRISSVANSADWIKLCYMNQKEQDALVKW